ncbi:hypothetical protein THAOC_34611 [Thalassiosira oceanica]|uniref:Uncharacterized protein n=1 Tax=Thalassiosira oceanica TaxID=159749 RepID=K0R390_THAOC|nr:hypothetical protein THAOC_34611 [Thalassiosira oceanica]|eukprot:EJK46705.1 hypothetical protein THAOC_34611 [Thalassiosira oceanica]
MDIITSQELIKRLTGRVLIPATAKTAGAGGTRPPASAPSPPGSLFGFIHLSRRSKQPTFSDNPILGYTRKKCIAYVLQILFTSKENYETTTNARRCLRTRRRRCTTIDYDAQGPDFLRYCK